MISGPPRRPPRRDASAVRHGLSIPTAFGWVCGSRAAGFKRRRGTAHISVKGAGQREKKPSPGSSPSRRCSSCSRLRAMTASSRSHWAP